MEVLATDYVPTNLDGLVGRCNHLLHNCKHPECDYHYGSNNLMRCPECDTPREKCSQYPAKGRDKCRYHGGEAAVGLAAGNHQGKGLSKSVPTRFLDKYVMHYQDPDVLNMVDDIALLKMRRDSLLEQLDTQAVADDQWLSLKEKYERLAYHMEQGHTNKIDEMMWALGHVIKEGYNSVLIWREINSTIEESRKVKDSEIKRRKIAKTIITEQQFNRVVGYIMSVIQNRVTDQKVLQMIMNDLERMNV